MSQWNCHQTEAYQEDLPRPTSNSKGNQLHFGRPSKMQGWSHPVIESSLQKMSTIKRAEKGWGGRKIPRIWRDAFWPIWPTWLAKSCEEKSSNFVNRMSWQTLDMPESDFENDVPSIKNPSSHHLQILFSRKCRLNRDVAIWITQPLTARSFALPTCIEIYTVWVVFLLRNLSTKLRHFGSGRNFKIFETTNPRQDFREQPRASDKWVGVWLIEKIDH